MFWAHSNLKKGIFGEMLDADKKIGVHQFRWCHIWWQENHISYGCFPQNLKLQDSWNDGRNIPPFLIFDCLIPLLLLLDLRRKNPDFWGAMSLPTVHAYLPPYPLPSVAPSRPDYWLEQLLRDRAWEQTHLSAAHRQHICITHPPTKPKNAHSYYHHPISILFSPKERGKNSETSEHGETIVSCGHSDSAVVILSYRCDNSSKGQVKALIMHSNVKNSCQSQRISS